MGCLLRHLRVAIAETRWRCLYFFVSYAGQPRGLHDSIQGLVMPMNRQPYQGAFGRDMRGLQGGLTLYVSFLRTPNLIYLIFAYWRSNSDSYSQNHPFWRFLSGHYYCKRFLPNWKFINPREVQYHETVSHRLCKNPSINVIAVILLQIHLHFYPETVPPFIIILQKS